MSETTPPPPPAAEAGQPYPSYEPNGTPTGSPAQPSAATPAMGPRGEIRSTGTCILLSIVTLGIYSLVWYYKTHSELKAHSGEGLGGPVALILALFVGFVMPFFTSSEVGGLYTRRGQVPPVTGKTGLWILLPLAGSIVWFVKTNGALNDYWRSQGATG
jgi:uncharacterized protein DUF4234